MHTLSTVIITLNEEKHLPACLESVKHISDEIIVVDSGSKDNTLEIAKKYNAQVFTRVFDNYANQKNFALSKTTCEWILSIDADEVIELKLADEIKVLLKSDNFFYSAYTIPRKNIIFGKYIKYTRWQPELDRHIWLWKRGSGKWEGDVHEEIKVKGKVGKLINAKVHYQYETVTEFMKMMNDYSELEAQKLMKGGTRFSYIKLIFSPPYNFFVRYFYRLGVLDGWRGFVLSYLMGIYHLILWVKIWERKN